MSKHSSKQELFELNDLYSSIVSFYGSFNKMDLEEKEITKKIQIITSGIKQDKNIVSLLKESNKRISSDLNEVKEEYGDIQNSMKEVAELVTKLEKMDSIETELAGLKRNISSIRLKVIPFSAKVWKLQEDLFRLQKEKKQVQENHSELMQKKNAFTSLAPKVLPSGELLDIKDRLAEEASRFEEKSKEIVSYKEELARLIPIRDDMKEELETIGEKLSSVHQHITSMEGKIKKLAPKIMPEEEMKGLSDDVNAMREKRRVVAEEKKVLSPRIASITEEEEDLTSILDSFRLKNKKDKDKLEILRKEQKGLNLDKDTVDKLREKSTSIEGELEGKRKEIDILKKEYSEVITANQKYKAIIKEVDEKTAKLKKMMKKK